MNLELENDKVLMEEYIKLHSENVWPQIIENIYKMGILDMEIYLSGYQAFLIMDTKKDFDLEKDSKEWNNMPLEKEWQKYVAKFQKTDPDSKISEKWLLMTRTLIMPQ